MSTESSNLPLRYLDEEWVVYADDEGDEYYYNLITTDTRWDNPLDDPTSVHPQPVTTDTDKSGCDGTHHTIAAVDELEPLQEQLQQEQLQEKEYKKEEDDVVDDDDNGGDGGGYDIDEDLEEELAAIAIELARQEEASLPPPQPTTPPPTLPPTAPAVVAAIAVSTAANNRGNDDESNFPSEVRQRSGSDLSDVTMSTYQPSVAVIKTAAPSVVSATTRGLTVKQQQQPQHQPQKHAAATATATTRYEEVTAASNPFAEEGDDNDGGNPFNEDNSGAEEGSNPFATSNELPSAATVATAPGSGMSLLAAAKAYKSISRQQKQPPPPPKQQQQQRFTSPLLQAAAADRAAAAAAPVAVNRRGSKASEMFAAPSAIVVPSEPLSICTARLMQLGVKKNAALIAQQRGGNFTQALQFVNASIRDHIAANPSIPSGLWAPRLEARIKSWLPNIPDEDNKEYHTGYIMVVTFFKIKDGGLLNWQLVSRFSALRSLQRVVQKYSKVAPLVKRFPAHQSMGLMLSGVTDAVRDQRRKELDAWLQELLSQEVLMTTPDVVDCLHQLIELEKHAQI